MRIAECKNRQVRCEMLKSIRDALVYESTLAGRRDHHYENRVIRNNIWKVNKVILTSLNIGYAAIQCNGKMNRVDLKGSSYSAATA